MSFLMSLFKFLFYGKIALRPISYVMKMLQKCLQQRCQGKDAEAKAPRTLASHPGRPPSSWQSLISCCSDSPTANSPRIRLGHSSFASPLVSPVHSRLILCPKQSWHSIKIRGQTVLRPGPSDVWASAGSSRWAGIGDTAGVLGPACPVSEGDPGLPTDSPCHWTLPSPLWSLQWTCLLGRSVLKFMPEASVWIS